MMESWLATIREGAAASAPELLSVLETYLSEARHGRSYIDVDLASLPRGAQVLEVGAGSLILSCQLVREGFAVTALEPVGEGFSHFHKMQELVIAIANLQGCLPVVLNRPAETLAVKSKFDFAFSINVMEHVKGVPDVIEAVLRSLKHNASYHFTCPNYLFPYEPHFDMPTFLSKGLTARIFRERIARKENMPDPWGTWNSLNWINVPMIKNATRVLGGVQTSFNREFLVSTFERVGNDPQFTQRRSQLMRAIIPILVRLRLHRFLGLVPAILQPIIDCRLTRVAELKSAQ